MKAHLGQGLRAIGILCALALGLAAQNHGKYDDIGDSEGMRCYYSFITLGIHRCEGSKKHLMTGKDDKDIVEWLDELEWKRPTAPSRRKTATGTEQTFVMQAIKGGEHVSLNALGDRGVIVARIIADPNAPPDLKYGIGHLSKYRSDFYIVVGDHKTWNPDGLESKTVQTWHVYGVDVSNPQAPKFVRVGKEGPLRWCGFDHDSTLRKAGSAFSSCPLSELAAAIKRENRSAPTSEFIELVGAVVARLRAAPVGAQGTLDAQLIAPVRLQFQMLLGSLTDARWQQILAVIDQYRNNGDLPAWMVCGVGCCTADEGP